MVGVPAFVVWTVLVVSVLLILGNRCWPCFTWGPRSLSFTLIHRFAKVTTAVNNALRHPELRRKAWHFTSAC